MPAENSKQKTHQILTDEIASIILINQPISYTDISQLLKIEPETLSTILDELIKDGIATLKDSSKESKYYITENSNLNYIDQLIGMNSGFIPFPRGIKVLDIGETLYLFELYYRFKHFRSKENGLRYDGRFWRTVKQINDATMLTKRQQKPIRESLQKKGYIDCDSGGGNKIFFRLNLDKIARLFFQGR